MPELTLESLARRVAVLEQQLAQSKSHEKDWRRSLGNMEDNEFTRQMYADMEAVREAEREAARRGEETP